MSWKDIIKEDFEDEIFSISVNGDSFVDGTFDNADLRFGLKQSTFGKIIDLIEKNKDSYDSYSVRRKIPTDYMGLVKGVAIDFKFDPYNEPLSFDSLAGKIIKMLKDSKYVKEVY
jgi:hypothetical protein|tara:strand:+ start:340 stop:684 length:345 start_codon:yes stop_codon:yes gene_type:complete